MKLSGVAVIGVGLIGGSVALAARKRALAERVIGFDPDHAVRARARERGVIDEAATDLPTCLRHASVAVFCSPVDSIAALVLESAIVCSPETLLMDTGSVKQAIVQHVEAHLPADRAFIGAHPLAGSEKHGVEHAEASLFEGRSVVLTPTPRTKPGVQERALAFWEALGATVRFMTPQEHDRRVATTSHLPHLAAAAMAGVLSTEERTLAARGFCDTTRVAAGDPSLWTGIFMQNRNDLLESLLVFERRLARFRHALETADPKAIHSLLLEGKKVRDALGD